MKILLIPIFIGVVLFGFGQASLPTYCSAFNVALPTGWTNTGAVASAPTHDECSGRAKTFNAVGIRLTIHINSAPTHIKYSISRNKPDNKTLILQESADNVTWTTVFTHTTANTPVAAAIHTRALNPLTRYVRFNMTINVDGKMEIDMVNIYNSTPNPLGNCQLLNLNCLDSKPICSDGSFTANNDDFGAQEVNAGNSGCLSKENQSNWYYFEPVTSGTLEFLITAGSGVDYDFAIWTGGCGSLGTPIRCSFAAATVPTGLSSSAADFSEGVAGNAIVAPLNIVAGQTYILFIDNWTANATPYTIDITLTGGASLDCSPTPLPIGLTYFNAENVDKDVLLTWTTESEHNNDYFTLERSRDGVDFSILAAISGAGNSTSTLNYEHHDMNPYTGISYYRLKQTDFDGNSSYSQTRTLNLEFDKSAISELYPNPSNQFVHFDVESTKIGQITVDLYDNTGRILLTKEFKTQKGTNSFNLDLNLLSQGVYSVIIHSDLLEISVIKQLIKK